MFTKTWFSLNWHWLLASILFIRINLLIKPAENLNYYKQIPFLCSLLISICLIFIFLWQKGKNKLAKLEMPIPIHSSMCILIILFTTICVMGHSIKILLKMAIWKKNVNVWNEMNVFLFQFILVLFLLLFPFYLFQRSKMERSGDIFDKFIRHFLNFTLCSIWLQYFLLDLFEDVHEKQHIEEMSKLFKRNISEWLINFTKEFEEKKDKSKLKIEFWELIYAQFIEHSICGITSELFSILLVCHLMASGSGDKIFKKVTMTSNQIMPTKDQIWIMVGKVPEGGSCSSDSISNLIDNPLENVHHNIRILTFKIVGFTIAILSICSVGTGIISKIENDPLCFWHLMIQLSMNFLIFGLFLTLFIFYTRKIPDSNLDANLLGQIQTDFLLLLASILSIFCAFLIDPFPNIMDNKNINISYINLFAEIFKMLGIFLIFLNIRKFATLSSNRLSQFQQFLPFLSICSSIYCAAAISNTFFQIRPNENSTFEFEENSNENSTFAEAAKKLIEIELIKKQLSIANYPFHLICLIIFLDLWHRCKDLARNDGNLGKENPNNNHKF